MRHKKKYYKYIIKICHEQHDIAKKKKVYFVIRVNKHLSSPQKWVGVEWDESYRVNGQHKTFIFLVKLNKC